MKSEFKFQDHFTGEPAENEVVGYLLENGLQLVMVKRHQTPIVTVDLWYKVGSRDEQPGKSGFAHLFEHLMFEGSENVGKAQHMKIINDIGGMVNGSTTQDRTNYWEIVPANQLELALWLEADRMRSLKVTAENFENQRATVKEERRLRIDNQPYMRVLYELKDELAYRSYPYQHSVIGSMADLDNASLQDVRRFHDTYYRPNNAILVLAGDFQAGQAYGLVNKHFGNIPAGPPVPMVELDEPRREAEARLVYPDPFAPFPALSISYHIPPRTHPDFHAVEILEKILLDGETSRFYSKLVEKEQVALHVLGGQDGKFGPGLFFVFAQLHPHHQLGKLEQAIEEEFASLAQQKISRPELEKARNKIKADFIAQQESVRPLADVLALGTMVYQDPGQYLREAEIYDAITVEDVQSAAAKYFHPQNRSVIEVQPQAGMDSPDR